MTVQRAPPRLTYFPRASPWLDMGDILFRKGPGCFHVAAELYKEALHRGADVLPAERQVNKAATEYFLNVETSFDIVQKEPSPTSIES